MGISAAKSTLNGQPWKLEKNQKIPPAKERRENLLYVSEKMITRYPIPTRNPSSKSPCPCLGEGTLGHSPDTSMFIFLYLFTALGLGVQKNSNGHRCKNKQWR